MTKTQETSVLRSDFGLLSQDDLSQLFDVTKETLREWRRLKQGPSFVRVGKGVFYRRQDVTNWLDANLVPAQPVAHG